MRRRLDLAASVMTRPPLLFLDEPTTGPDPTGRQRAKEASRRAQVEVMLAAHTPAIPS